jgi:hypothetical protein
VLSAHSSTLFYDPSFEVTCTDISPEFRRHTNVELDVGIWDCCEVQNVNQLPYDIDGLCTFVIPCSREDMMRCSRDGRPWKTWVTSSRKGFAGIRRVARCKGFSVCLSNECPFLQNGTGPNRSHFKMHGGCLECFTCGTAANTVYCDAVKVLEYDMRQSCVTVMHVGNHTCQAKMPKVNRAVILKAVAQNPGVKPNKLVND